MIDWLALPRPFSNASSVAPTRSREAPPNALPDVAIAHGDRCMLPRRYAWLPRYGVALVATALAPLMSLALRPVIERVPFTLFFAALAISVSYGGLGPGLLTTLLSVILIDHF